MSPRIQRRDFDAALVPGFRDATAGAYRELTAHATEDMRSTLDEGGRMRAELERLRDCPLCGAPNTRSRPFMQKLGMRIVECDSCRLIYSVNVLDEDYDHQRYVASAATASFESLKRNEAYAALERVKSRYIVQWLERHATRKGRLLDVGPGAARLLDAARASGWETHGLELNPEFVRRAREAGHRIVEGAFPRDLEAGERFDAIVMLDVLEHLHRPREALEACTPHLAGGVLVVQVPNVDSLLLRIEGPASLNFCHGHWNHFTPRTLTSLLGVAGYEPLHVETIISEIDRIRAFPASRIEAAARAAGAPAPPAEFDAEWLHAHGLGYKVLGFYARKRIT